MRKKGVIVKDRKKALVVLSLGVGVQSTTMALMAAKGDLPKVDCAIFADPGYESKSTMLYLDYLTAILPYPVYRVQKGNIKDDMLAAKGTTNFVVAPFYNQHTITGKKGMIRRQCTSEYKILVIKKKIRELCNVGFNKRFPKDKYVEQWIGISTDEISRMKPSNDKYILNKHPLIDLNMSRQDCVTWLNKNGFPLPEKSACIVCPFHNDAYWHFMKTERKDEFEEAVNFDKRIRTGSKKIKDKIYLHRSCKPLDEIEFNKKEDDSQLDMFSHLCDEGMCGV